MPSRDVVELLCEPHVHMDGQTAEVHLILECQRVSADLTITLQGPWIIFHPPRYSQRVHVL